MIIKRDTQTHDLSGADATIEMSENIGAHKTFTCQLSWDGVIGNGAKAILRGSNNRKTFLDLGIEVILTAGSDSAGLSDDKFPYDFGAVAIEKGGASAGIITLKFLAK